MCRRNKTRRAREKYKADPVGAGGHRRVERVLAIDAADLDGGHAISAAISAAATPASAAPVTGRPTTM